MQFLVAGGGSKESRSSSLDELSVFLAGLGPAIDESHRLLAAGETDAALRRFGDVLWEINRFLYLQGPGLDDYYVSKFHQLWDEHAERILSITVSDAQCRKVAEIFEKIHQRNKGRFHAPLDKTFGLGKEQVANVRFLTAAQDWKLRQNVNPYEIASHHPDWFEPAYVSKYHPEAITRILKEMQVDPDQAKKRFDYARNGAEFLIDRYKGSAFQLGPAHDFDAAEIRRALVVPDDEKYREHLGFSYKKADMFIRDMYDLEVWPLTRLDALDVPPDLNTMKAALRTGMLQTPHPLLTSYLDVYSSQYGLVTDLASRAWRRVWELWRQIPNSHPTEGPAFFDYLLYDILSRQCLVLVNTREISCSSCRKTSLVKPRTRRCPHCSSTSIISTGQLGNEDEFQLLLSEGCDFCKLHNTGVCVFQGIVSFGTWKLSPPRSISRIGGTGWDDGRSNEDSGGGGITA